MTDITDAEVNRRFAELEQLEERRQHNVTLFAKLTVGWLADSGRARVRQRGEWSAVKGATLTAVMLPVMLVLMALAHAPLLWAVWMFAAAIIGIGVCLLFAILESENRPKMR